MNNLSSKVRSLPDHVLSAPGRALLEEILHLNTNWAVDIEQFDGNWYLIEKGNDIGAITPIEVFQLEEGDNLF